MSKETGVMHKFSTGKIFSPVFLGAILVFIVLGSAAGYFIANMNNLSSTATDSPKSTGDIEKGKIFGSNDTGTFKDSTDGVLKEGGIDGEGQYHLVRPGGESQNVYMTSSLVDLGLFKNRKIKVWGQTQTAQKAGWLMDVGRVEVLE